VNSRSIGIDLQGKNGKYSDVQYTALNNLLKDISSRRGIKLDDTHLLAHFEVIKKYHDDPLNGFKWLDVTGITYDHREKNGGNVIPALVTDANIN
jgi:N-acetyl-anhydromuramyl-L-alanine amidase AmpD